MALKIRRHYKTEVAEYAQIEMPDASRMEFKIRGKASDAAFLALAQNYWNAEEAAKPARAKEEKLRKLYEAVSDLQAELGAIIAQWKTMTAKQQRDALVKYPMLATLKDLTTPMAIAIGEVR